MLAAMNTGQPFNIEFVTLDKQRQKGGELRVLEGARKKGAGIDGKPETEAPTGKPRNPNHADNGTINLVCVDRSLLKVHTRLITKFNSEDVAL